MYQYRAFSVLMRGQNGAQTLAKVCLNELIAVSNFAHKFLPHHLLDTAINNIAYMKTQYMLV